MKLILGTEQVPLITSIGRTEYIGGISRQILELWTETPLTSAQITALATEWSIEDDGGTISPQRGYTEVIRHSTWVAQTDPNAAIVAEKEAQIIVLNEQKTELIAEKEEVVTNLNTVKQSVRAVFTGRKDDLLVELMSIMEPWDAYGSYVPGDVRKHNGAPYTAIQASDPQGNLDWSPDKTPALWAVYHAQSAEFALPWVAPTHAEDIYKIGEWMVWTDGKKYEAIANTDRGPDILPNNWKVEGAVTEPPAEEPPTQDPPTEPPAGESPAPVEKNSNGTDVWSEWVVWNNLNETLYQIGDRVTVSNVKYIAILGDNHWNPTSGIGWEPYTEPQA